MDDPSISQAVPTVASNTLAELLGVFGLSPNTPLTDLLSLGPKASQIFTTLAEHLMANTPDRRLRQILPGLHRVSSGRLPLQTLTTRAANSLIRAGVLSWSDLSHCTPAELLALPALARRSVTEIIELALLHAVVQLLRGEAENTTPADVLALEPDESGTSGPELSAAVARTAAPATVLPGLETLARWAVSIDCSSTLGEALDLAASSVLPADVAEAVGAFRDTPLELVAPDGSAFSTAYQLLWARCGDERRQAILRRRITFDAPTLEELGEGLSLTRERVRQLQKEAGENIRAFLSDPMSAEIRWRVAQLRERIGTAIPWSGDLARDALATATNGLPDSERATAEALLLWLAGPYRLDRESGWIFVERAYLLGVVGPRSEIGPPPRASLVAAISDDQGVVDIVGARQLAAAVGLVPAASEAWIATCPFRDVDGTLVRWQGNIADKAEVLLALLNRPATADELNDLIAEGHSVRGLRNRLLDEKRFVRTDRHRIGLRRWGLEEYTGIVDEIEEEIERRGGEADVDDLVRTVTKQFGLQMGSVISYTGVPRFVTENRRIRVRRAEEPYMPTRTLFDEPGAFLVDDDRCAYRLRVDREMLRGSGRTLPQGVGAWLGVLPGDRRQFRFPDGGLLLISWPQSALLGPALGSLRRQAIALGAKDGDYLMLVFNRGVTKSRWMLCGEWISMQ